MAEDMGVDKMNVNELPSGEFTLEEVREAISSAELKNQIIKMHNDGIPEEEILRTVLSYLHEDNPQDSNPWPGPVTGWDLMPQVPIPNIPDTGYPPVYQPNTRGTTEPYPHSATFSNTPQPQSLAYHSEPSPAPKEPIFVLNMPYPGDNQNWLANGADHGEETPTIGVTGFNYQKDIPEWKFPIEDSQSMAGNDPPVNFMPSFDAPQFHQEPHVNETKKPKMAKYHYTSHERDDFCKQFDGKTYDLSDRSSRPVIPSEGLGYVNTHPNCQCYWEIVEQADVTPLKGNQKKHFEHINRVIGAKAHYGSLHKVHKDGKLYKTTTNVNPRLKEAIGEVRNEFDWLTDDYLQNAKVLTENAGKRLYLIRASAATLTDHRSEGEPYKRKLASDELYAMARTATTKGMDINHYGPEFMTDSQVLDSEGDLNRGEIQMIVAEGDPEINAAIDRGEIDAVSINGGAPRTMPVEPCNGSDGELCSVPRGVILGENDGIALTWVVTAPQGITWRGRKIPKAKPGVGSTKIERI